MVTTGWEQLGKARFVSLTTFRRNGEAVATPVWIAPLGPDLVVTTPSASGKVKRLRNDGRVRLTPCNRFGATAAGAPTIDAHCVIAGSDTDHPDAATALRRKYGLQYRGIVAVEGMVRRWRKEDHRRLILRIRPEPS